MTGHTYLLKSRHGVYYFRAVEPSHGRDRLGGHRREIRISLRTKDRALAKRLVAKKAYFMSKPFDLSAQAEADQDDALFDLGQTIASKIGRVDTDDPRAVDSMIGHMSNEEAQAYLFYCTYVEGQEERQRTKQQLMQVQLHQPASQPMPMGRLGEASHTVPTDLPPANPQSAKTDCLVTTAILRFVESKKTAVRGPTADKYGTHCQLFLKIIARDRSDLKLSSITHEDLHHYIDTLPKVKKKTATLDPRPLTLVAAGSKDAMAKKTIFSHAIAVN